jgi:hypothetical protein
MPKILDYKGSKILELNPEEKFVFSFGIEKAKMILKNIDSIKKFISTNGKNCEIETTITDYKNETISFN